MTSIHHEVFYRNSVQIGGIGKLRSDPLPSLIKLITQRLGSSCRVLHTSTRPWASALFEGRRHEIILVVEGSDALERRTLFGTQLADAEWPLSGHFIADIVIDSVHSSVEGEIMSLSALSIEDW